MRKGLELLVGGAISAIVAGGVVAPSAFAGPPSKEVIERVEKAYRVGKPDIKISPDGEKLAVQSMNSGNWEIYVLDSNGKNPVNVSRNRAFDAYPGWADNNTVRFLSDRGPKLRSGLREYLVDADGTNLRCPAVSEARKKTFGILGASLLTLYLLWYLDRKRKGLKTPNVFRALYKGLRANISGLEELKQEFPNWSSLYFDLGNKYLEQGDFDLMLENYKKGVELRPNNLPSRIISFYPAHSLERWAGRRAAKKEPVRGYTALAMCDYADYRFDESIRAAQLAVENWEGEDVYSHAFFAQLLDNIREVYDEPPKTIFSLGDSIDKLSDKVIKKLPLKKKKKSYTKTDLEEMANREWAEVADFVMQHSEEFKYEPVGESRNETYILKPTGKYGSFADALILKKNALKELELERAFTRKLSEVVQDCEEYAFPRDLAIAQHNGDYFYIMKREQGTTLFEQINSGSDYLEEIGKFAEFIGLVYARAPLEIVRQQETDYFQKIRAKLGRMSLPEEVTEKILLGILPAIEAVGQSPLVVGQDPHPENLLKGKKRMLKFDCEDLGLSRLGCDFANLFCYGRYMDFGQIREAAARALPDYEPDELMLWLSNGILLRSISLNEALKNRGTRKETRSQITQNGIDFIDLIKEEFSGHYGENRTNYDSLKEGMLELQELTAA